MRIAFAGTPEFAAVALEAILAASHEVRLVLTQPDRPSGRGQKLVASPVKQLAARHGIAVHQPERLKDPATHAPLLEAAVDVLVVAAYGLILPQAVLDIPRLGCINIHASLLPRWRGAAPIQRAIEAGDPETGVTIMRMEAGLDTGPMLLKEALPIAADDSAATLHDKLAAQGGRLIAAALDRLDSLAPVAQPEAGVTYANKIEKREAVIDWSQPAAVIERRIRAFDPFPGALSSLRGETLKLWHATTAEGGGAPGTVLAVAANGIVVACGEGALRLSELQKPGGRRLASADFLHGCAIAPGERFVAPA
ncbi:MAG: methionyl-tRNA formyltransferase [Gammaproteobacteria bacterium]|nr:methionyl-tRNA formyltransferase [Gammaproteobacteria bacterium]MBU1644896.1 methionyl-tRNA formyltransferase [Gammaproteobacteria bacterium]MBU1971355.1 methionyl-tRNA formyltransferase [Gammaproteobacteria bacterium]